MAKFSKLLRRLFSRSERQPATQRKPKTVLFHPHSVPGSVNSLLVIANRLKEAGHNTVFLLTEPIRYVDELEKKGHLVYDCTTDSMVPSMSPPDHDPRLEELIDNLKQGRGDHDLGVMYYYDRLIPDFCDKALNYEAVADRKIEQIKPDLIISDSPVGMPSLHYPRAYVNGSIIPYILVWSAGPLGLSPADKLNSGLKTSPNRAADNRFRQSAKYFQKAMWKAQAKYRERWCELVKSTGHQLPKDRPICAPTSVHLNVLVCPSELYYDADYDFSHCFKDWLRVDCLIRNPNPGTYGIPLRLMIMRGKLIYFSLGCYGCLDVSLMKRLIEIFSTLPHRFIVSLGPKANEYLPLPSNMVGSEYVDQLQVLNTVDLVITNGGNMTIAEALYFGLPSLVLPLFGDQFSNASKLADEELGMILDPFTCTQGELIGCINYLLQKTGSPRMNEVKRRMRQAAAKPDLMNAIQNFLDQV